MGALPESEAVEVVLVDLEPAVVIPILLVLLIQSLLVVAVLDQCLRQWEIADQILFLVMHQIPLQQPEVAAVPGEQPRVVRVVRVAVGVEHIPGEVLQVLEEQAMYPVHHHLRAIMEVLVEYLEGLHLDSS